ncbi:MAG TPA: hypothetical protein VJ803_11565 [Gemmatimonadaceae bacterium]|nr:hypothetical protein [Gemmatimonadaceae bacterium]
MYRMRLHARLLIALLALTITSCAPDSATAPANDGDIASVLQARGAEEAQLQLIYEAELERTRLEAELSARIYDSLMVVDQQQAAGDLLGPIGGLLSQVTGLLLCKPLPYASTVKIVGREGGTINVGPHTLTIPRGALKKNTVITAEVPASRAVTVRFSPHGLEFQQSPTLTLSYAHCKSLPLLPKRIVYTNELLKILENLLSLDMPRQKKVQAEIDHFSRYAVAF